MNVSCRLMGDAPRSRRYPAMPDPDRVVGRSVSMLKRIGYTDREALQKVCEVAYSAYYLLTDDHDDALSWLRHIGESAYVRERLLYPSITDHQESDYGDGPGGRAGRAAEH